MNEYDRKISQERRLMSMESDLEYLKKLTKERNDDLEDFRKEVRSRFDASDSRLVQFAFVVAGSSLGIALTVFFTR